MMPVVVGSPVAATFTGWFRATVNGSVTLLQSRLVPQVKEKTVPSSVLLAEERSNSWPPAASFQLSSSPYVSGWTWNDRFPEVTVMPETVYTSEGWLNLSGTRELPI